MNKLATPKIIVKLVNVTPDMALEMLEKNTMNRNIDQKRVEQYVQDMRCGRWQMNGTTIEEYQAMDNDTRLGWLRGHSQYNLFEIMESVTRH